MIFMIGEECKNTKKILGNSIPNWSWDVCINKIQDEKKNLNNEDN
jgi:hypothetical protein